MFGLERPYPGCVLKSLGVILMIKTLIFLRFSILADISVLLGNLPSNCFWRFFSFFNKIQDSRQNHMSLSRA